MSFASDISQLRKSGKLEEALEKSREHFSASPDDIYLQRAYGWVIYDLVKREVHNFKQNKVSAGRLANRFNEWMSEYRIFGANDRPGMLHSLLLNQVLKGSRDWQGFLDFARWWGPEFLRHEDKESFTIDNGKKLPSTALKYFYAIGREISHRANELPHELLAWGEAQVDSALEDTPDDQWLHYFKSKLLLDKGKVNEARACLMPVVRRQRRAAWVWTLLGQTFEADGPETAITCYFRAVQVAVQAQEVANTRISLAHLLASAGHFEAAAVQVRKALEYRQDGNFSVPQALVQMVGSDWYRPLAKRTDLPPEPDVSDEIENILFGAEGSGFEYCLGVVDNQNLEKSLAHVSFALDDGVVLNYRRFNGIADVTPGDLVEIGMSTDDHKAVRWRKTSDDQIPGFFQSMVGELSQRSGQPFGFVVAANGERIFVHPNLMAGMADAVGTQVRCRAVMAKDKEGRPGWRALKINATADVHEPFKC